MRDPRKPASSVETWPTLVVSGDGRHELPDPVVVEEPLEIRLLTDEGTEPTPLTVTMRTPGQDPELATGLLYTEALIEQAGDLVEVRESADPARPLENRVDVRLRPGLALDPARTARSFVSSSACGVCGKAAVDAIFVRGFPPLPRDGPILSAKVLEDLPERLRESQEVFARTGGLHAAGLFDRAGNLLCVREDVGRHNAVDKLIGARLREDRVPASDAVLVVSGRAGFEITQKALRAGIPILAAVGAPSSLTLRLAERSGMTVVGFLRAGRFNVYTAAHRIEP